MMTTFLCAQLQIALHIAEHEDHFHCETNLLSKVDFVHVNKNIANLSRKNQNQSGRTEACQIFANEIQNIILKMEPIAEVRHYKKGQHHKEVCLLIDCLVGNEESKGRDEEDGCIYLRRILFHLQDNNIIQLFIFHHNFKTTNTANPIIKLILFFHSFLLYFPYLNITCKNDQVHQDKLSTLQMIADQVFEAIPLVLYFCFTLYEKLQIFQNDEIQRGKIVKKPSNAMADLQDAILSLITCTQQFLMLQQFI